LIEACPGATVAQLQAAILKACARMPNMQVDRANLGIPDGVKALAVLKGLVAQKKTAAARS
jgi:hypothetical protein